MSTSKNIMVVFIGVVIGAIIVRFISGPLSSRDFMGFGAFLVGIIGYIIWRNSKNKSTKNN